MPAIAVLSDTHGNLPALEAVLDDLDRHRDILGAYHLGDLVGYAPWPNEVVALLRAEGIGGIAGNYDSTVAANYAHCGCRYEDPHQEALSHQSFAWTLQHTSPETKAHLGSLPFRMDLRPRGGHIPGPKVILIHGNPVLNTVYWTVDRPDSFCLQMAEKAGARPGDVIVFGHTHKPWDREIDGIRFVNAGSVGRPKDGDWRACYLLLHLEERTPRGEAGPGPTPGAAPERPRAEWVRVEYDLSRAQAGIRDSDLPDEFADFLAVGGVFEES